MRPPHTRSAAPEVRTKEDLSALLAYFETRGTLCIPVKANGLYGAADAASVNVRTGYQYTWVRDTVMIANFQRETGDTVAAAKTVRTLSRYLESQEHRFVQMIREPTRKSEPALRPHIRFDGDTLTEIPEPWPHAQNDALGYAMWLAFLMANAGNYDLDDRDGRIFGMFPAYFSAIQYWRDADSGHWEETPKVNSSSIGVVVGALRQMTAYLRNRSADGICFNGEPLTQSNLLELEARGLQALRQLPYESFPHRKADAALLFLIYPMNVVSLDIADQIISQTESTLVGAHGIRRYEGDSYWCQDYDAWNRIYDRPEDFDGLLTQRDNMLKAGCEAQWCLFDPILSIYNGQRYQRTGNPRDLSEQLRYLNRATSQLTPDGKCAELYYLRKDTYVPNEHVPLAWTQANLGIAVEYMKRSFGLA